MISQGYHTHHLAIKVGTTESNHVCTTL